MNAYHYYTLVGGCLACYTLGMMHAKEHRGWQNFGMAVLTGAVWPYAVIYGIYLVHFADRRAKRNAKRVGK